MLPEESGARGIVGISWISSLDGSGEAGVLLSGTFVSGDAGVDGISRHGDAGDPLVSGETIWVSGETGVSGDVGVSAISSEGSGESGVMRRGDDQVLLTARDLTGSVGVLGTGLLES